MSSIKKIPSAPILKKKRESVVEMPPSEEQINELQLAFSIMDIEGVGEITSRELKAVVTALGYRVTEEEVICMLNEMDEDDSGTIEFHEFFNLMTRKLSVEDEDEELQAAFKSFDKDNDGFISVRELENYMIGLGQVLSEEEIQEMISEADKDKDGKVSYDDFRNLMQS